MAAVFGNGQRLPVLLMVRELDQGGIERDVAKIAMRLDRSRFEPHVSTYSARGMRYEELRRAGVPIVHLPVGSVFSPSALHAARLFRAYLRENGIRVVHAYDSSGIFGLPVARAAGVPVVLTSQLCYRELMDPKTRALLRLTDRFTDAVVVNCEAMARHMEHDEHVAPSRIELCYNGVDTTVFYPALVEKPEVLRSAPLVIGSLCALREEKNLPLLVEAFSRVAPLKPGMRLVLVGSGNQLRRLEELASNLGVRDSVIFVPATPDVPYWLRAIDIFVLPSYSEAFSNALLEAMACGCCVVGSRVGGTPELIGEDAIGESQRGRLFTSRDVGDLANQLELLISDAALRRELGARAAAFVHSNLNMDVAARRTAAIYEERLRKKRGTGIRDWLRSRVW